MAWNEWSWKVSDPSSSFMVSFIQNRGYSTFTFIRAYTCPMSHVFMPCLSDDKTFVLFLLVLTDCQSIHKHIYILCVLFNKGVVRPF